MSTGAYSTTKPRFAAVLPTTSFELTRSLAERAEAGGSRHRRDRGLLRIRGRAAGTTAGMLHGAAAMATKRAKLTQLVACNSFRHPAMTAKIATTIDHIRAAAGSSLVSARVGSGKSTPHSRCRIRRQSARRAVGRGGAPDQDDLERAGNQL